MMDTPVIPINGRAASLDEVFKMQDIITAFGEPEEMPLRHFFSPGLYLREITMRADLLVVGKMHATTHFNIITKGDVTVLTDNGPLRITVTDHPYIFVSKAGTKKVLYCHEDTVWMTTHLTDLTDIAEIEKQVIIPEEALRDESGNILLDEESLKLLLGDKL
jgi:hypothetical protein